MHTITTTVQKEGAQARTVVTQGERRLIELWGAHTNAVEAHTGVTGVEKVQEEKHPLESVFKHCGLHGERWAVSWSTANIDLAFAENMRSADGEHVWFVCGCVATAAHRVRKLNDYQLTEPEVWKLAITQATKGKGQRHGGDKTPFLEQPWVRLYKTHGLGFLLGQADKKYHEACGKENKEDAEREFLGAIVYLGMALLVLEGKVK